VKRLTVLTWVFLGFAILADAAGLFAQTRPVERDTSEKERERRRIPEISGRWYLGGDHNKPCSIRQRRGSDRASFINEHGSQARGSIRGKRVFIPDWGENCEGQDGTIRGDRIVWADGNYWSR
jgi:hypothetical protein